jgi:hypothetical protein
MSFKTTWFQALLVAAIIGVVPLGAGCGNYSNEDLEFMNALPEKEDLTAQVPARSALVLGDAAELYRMTRDVAGVFNGIVDAFLSLIDTIRSYPPTTRRTNERIWGPGPAKEQPGWLVQMDMVRKDLATFRYAVQFRRADFVGAADQGWIDILTGTFAAAGGVRKGSGTLVITTAAARAAGLDPNLGSLDQMTALYDTHAFPITVNLMFKNLANPVQPTDPTEGTYAYAAQENGQGALMFDFSANSIAGPAGLDTFEVTSRWLGTGEGRGDLQVVSGDAAGARETQCWDQRFRAVYTDKPWAPLEDIGAPSDCAAIPTL